MNANAEADYNAMNNSYFKELLLWLYYIYAFQSKRSQQLKNHT